MNIWYFNKLKKAVEKYLVKYWQNLFRSIFWIKFLKMNLWNYIFVVDVWNKTSVIKGEREKWKCANWSTWWKKGHTLNIQYRVEKRFLHTIFLVVKIYFIALYYRQLSADNKMIRLKLVLIIWFLFLFL